MPDIGKDHNEVGGLAADRLISFCERIERLEEEKATLGADIREVYSESKSAGYDVPTLRKIIKERKKDRAQRDEEEALLDLYRRAVGLLADTPLGQAAVVRLATAK